VARAVQGLRLVEGDGLEADPVAGPELRGLRAIHRGQVAEARVAAGGVPLGHEEDGKPLFGSAYPKTLPADWEKDAALNRRLRARTKPRYAHLYGCEVWLPHEVKDTFEAPSPGGKRVRMGSVFDLLRNLETLNDRTFNGSAEDKRRWAADMPNGEDVGFEPKAKTGLAIMLELAAAAARERLPMLLDY